MQQLAISAFGEPETLQLQEADRPDPGQGQCLVRVHFAGVNPVDCKTRAGLGWAAKQLKDALPWVPGYDMAGEIVSCGPGVTGFEVGQRVFGLVGFPHQGGCYSQYLVADASELCPAPDELVLSKAAALPVVGLTAWQGLFEHGRLQAGERVLILGAGGAVGQLAVQLAADCGAEVSAVARVNYKMPLMMLGAQEIYQVARLPDGIEVDLVLDLIGGDTACEILGKLGAFKRVVTIPSVSVEQVTECARTRGAEACGMMLHPDADQLAELADKLASERVKLAISDIYLLSQGVRAHQRLERGGVGGKLLLRMFDEC
ncbi:NADP-dependent oxidoreductase [Dongshaea marina]|uniref:NADP-dependent oxidoreductase n=1 Tax=Dongshaea marina TaxID=2047966 RepID=UPI00131F102C|nr:NADP-dependent oxidoreductase [Dongshaea marina]